jgi:hypothetical protein
MRTPRNEPIPICESIPTPASVNSFSGHHDAQTDNLINEAMAIAAVVLTRKPDMETLNKVAAVNRGVELVAFYPCILKFRQNLTNALDDLASLLESRDSTLARKVRGIWVSADAMETRVGMGAMSRAIVLKERESFEACLRVRFEESPG